MRSVRRLSISSPFLAASSIALLLNLSLTDWALGQSTYNPYEAMSSQFRNYSRPGGMNPFDTMSGNRSQSNTFQQEMDKLFGGRETSSGQSRDSNRYYNAFRKYDADFDRIYRPNMEVDQIYNERRNSRESDYFRAFREKNPRRRAELMRAFERGEDVAALKDDSKPDETTAAERRKASAAKSRSDSRSPLTGGLRSNSSGTTRSSGLLDSKRSTGMERGGRPASGLLNSREEPRSSRGGLLDDMDKPKSLTERSGQLSEKIRPSSPSRGYGPFRSREEMLRDQNKNGANSRDPSGLQGLLP
jgi:hypothetical protein